MSRTHHLCPFIFSLMALHSPAHAAVNDKSPAKTDSAAPTTLQKAKLKEQCNVFDFLGAAQVEDVSSDTAALDVTEGVQAAIDTCITVYLDPGKYRITHQLVLRHNATRLYGAGELSSKLDKRFNGELLFMQNGGAELASFGIIGNGALYRGGGIKATGNSSTIKKLRIEDTQDSPIILQSGTAVYLTIEDCFLLATEKNNIFAIRQIGTDAPAAPTARTFSRISGGGALVDFSGMNAARLINSFGTNIKFSPTSGKIYLAGNRFTVNADIGNIIIKGVDHYIDANQWGFAHTGQGLIIDATAANVFLSPGNAISVNGRYMQTVTDNAPIGGGNANNLSTQLIKYPFRWFGSNINPEIGNAATYAWYKQDGRMVYASFGVVVGGTTSIGQGTWSFQLPFKAMVTQVGNAVVRTAHGVYYPAAVEVQGNSSTATLYVSGANGPLGSASLPFETGAVIEASIAYVIATQ